MIAFSNPLLIFDLELTAPDDARGDSELIEIGAVLLDPDFQERGHFSALIRPEQPLNPRIAALTGITDEMLAEADSFAAVIERFEAWLSAHIPDLMRLRLSAWGIHGDIPALRAAYARCGRPWPFAGSAVDVKSIAMVWLALSGRRTDKAGLFKVAKHMQLLPIGAWHRALVDAEITARVLVRVFSDLDTGVFILDRRQHTRQLVKLVPVEAV